MLDQEIHELKKNITITVNQFATAIESTLETKQQDRSRQISRKIAAQKSRTCETS